MSKTIEEWKNTDVAAFDKLSNEDKYGVQFFRQPTRPMISDTERMFSPASGVLLYCKHVTDPYEDIVDVKGINFSVFDLTRGFVSKPCWVAGIFMSQYDIHSNTMPYAGIVNYKLLPPLKSKNVPMLETEHKILEGIIPKSTGDYLHDNERMISTVFCCPINYTYHMVQIADSDVDVICPMGSEQGSWFAQTQKFSFIRYGSQCDLILPDSNKVVFTPLINPICHVEQGQDALFSVRKTA